jgi:plastocyanin
MGAPSAAEDSGETMRRLLATLSLVALVAVGCGGGSSKAPVSLPGPTNNHGTKTARDDLAVVADNYSFSPTFLTASAWQKFTVQLRNDGSARHTFTSPTMNIDLELAPGAARSITLTAPASGSVEFHCRFHQSQGMQGAVYVK